MSTYGVAYGDSYVNYPPMELYDGFQAEDCGQVQGLDFYDTCYPKNADECSGNLYYGGFPADAIAPQGMAMYMDYGMSPMTDMNATVVYSPQDMEYNTAPKLMYYGEPGYAYSTLMDCGKTPDDDTLSKLEEVSTAATTPCLDAKAPPEQINDGFELGYGCDFNATAYVPMEQVPNMSAAPGDAYYVNFPYNYNLEETFTPYEDTEAMINSASIIEIANEIVANVQYLPEKEANGKYSLDSNHPIHCVWRDLNRGHCSWRCRWWENGKRLSKNFNVKRFGEREAMWMAIAMKIRNSTPVERYQLLKEQREAVRNHLELLRQNADVSGMTAEYLGGVSMNTPAISQLPRRKRQSLSSAKRAQRLNWLRISWTYVKVSERHSGETSVVCRLCAKTTKCSRRRNLQQAHIMHLLRMHKNPWKKYLHEEGLTKMCRNALDALYEQRGYTDDSEWKLRPGLIPPEPIVNMESLEESDSIEE